jgi:prepilin-type N-terminal cleavage/methylation domain-containing protein
LPTSRTSETAFTLLEVVVVLAVLALAVGLVLPRFGDVGALSVDAAAGELAATINLTRERAILGARPLRGARRRCRALDRRRHGARRAPGARPPAAHHDR